jgi:hypothetical protein
MTGRLWSVVFRIFERIRKELRMKRFFTCALAAVMALGLTSTVYANICATDAEPAATLLFPFVQYDYEGGDNGVNTLFAITNVSEEATIVHITVWTDYSIAILDFNLTLTGYDVQTLSIRDILRDGVLPHDATGANEWWNGQDPGDTPPGPGTNAGGSPFEAGPFSPYNQLWGTSLNTYFGLNGLGAPDSTHFLNCAPPGTPAALNPYAPDEWVSSPVNYATPIPQGTLDIFQGYLQSSQLNTTAYSRCGWNSSVSFTNGTWYTNQDPRPTWMYVTADVVGACNKELPDGATAYFNPLAVDAAGLGVPTGLLDSNQLIGDVIWVDPINNFSEADNAVHIEAVDGLTDRAAAPFDTTDIPGTAKDTTFYARYHLTQAAWEDDREPLPSAWAFRYLVADAADVTTSIRAFKASTVFAVNDDLRGPDVDDPADGIYDPITGPNPAEMWANSCYAYTYYAWDEDENVNSVGPGFEPPWSGGPSVDPIPVPNLLPLETQEVSASQFFLVGDPGLAFGWMLFVWPNSNNTASYGLVDHYQTWMGARYGYGTYSAALSGAVMANYSCDATEVLPVLGLLFVD